MRQRLWTEMTNRSVAAWCKLVVAAAVLLGAAWWNVWEISRTWDYVDAAFVSPTPGSLEIARCDEGTESKGNWTCHGPFTSTDGAVRIDSISLRVPVEAGPGTITPAMVSGTDAEGAWSTDWGMAVGRLGVHAIAGAAGFFAWLFFQLAGDSDEPARRPVRGARTPRLPHNQHRNRRRRKTTRRR
ncbi:hypothetical protein [Micromonospora sp. NPDC048063]|uniref:hypothetical protein n=1 Tax=Micromonospora sp. NPDC048063 TaxID=3364256 RepID=UPI00371768A1